MGEKAKAFTLFATHYFELTALAQELPACGNVHLDATEHGGQLVFLHAVKPGPANQSYGLQVASLAGVPSDVIRRAKRYLKTLESQQAAQGNSPQAQLDFSAEEPDADDPVRQAVDALDPDAMSPREALDALLQTEETRCLRTHALHSVLAVAILPMPARALPPPEHAGRSACAVNTSTSNSRWDCTTSTRRCLFRPRRTEDNSRRRRS